MKQSMSTKGKWVLAAVGLLLVVLVFKIVLLITAKPKIKVDYVAEYNKFSRPQNYEPNNNAAPIYQKAFDAFVKIPDELPMALGNSNADWPDDFNNYEQTILKQWVMSNSKSFEFLKTAISKPYYWLERHAEDDNETFSILLPELSEFRELANALMWNAKNNAIKGQFQSAFEDIINCYKMGSQKCRPELLKIEQFNGMAIKENAVQTAFIILNKESRDNKSLKLFQDALQTEYDRDNYIPNFGTEKLFLFDALQRIFLDEGKSKLSWRACWDASSGCSDLTSKWPFFLQAIWPNLKLRLNCFIGPTRDETEQKIEQTITLSNQMMTKTPWQIKNKGQNYLKEIDNINKSNFFLSLPIGIEPKGIYDFYYNTKAGSEALVAVIAILRFKTDTGQYPDTLNNLTSKNYLESTPQDPYSDNSLIYKSSTENFKLYSVGPDFKDDGGKENNDIVFWPVWERPKIVDYNQPISEPIQPMPKPSE